jgi:GT2 family glycosyltransferase
VIAPAAALLAGSHPPSCTYDADILILSLDRIEETEAAIRSALAQVDLGRHVIVFDQGSAPAALARLTALASLRTDMLLASAGTNLGVAAGRNRAASFGHGRTLVVLDNDAEFADATTAARAVQLLDAQPALAAIGFRIMNGDGSGEDDASWGYPAALRPQAASRFASATFVGAGHAIRRQAWQSLGGYDDNLFFTWEEYDFALRAIDQGWCLLHAGDIAVHHKLATERRVGWGGRRWFFYVRNRLYIARKWQTPWTTLAIRLAGYSMRSVRLGVPRQGIAGAVAAFRMPLGPDVHRMSHAGLAYLHTVDGSVRGGVWARMRGEVLASLPPSKQR